MSNQHDIKKQLVDQSLHILVGFVILGVAVYFHSILALVISAMAIGLVKELTESGSKITSNSFKSATSFWSLVDIAFWGLGGFLAGLIFL